MLGFAELFISKFSIEYDMLLLLNYTLLYMLYQIIGTLRKKIQRDLNERLSFTLCSGTFLPMSNFHINLGEIIQLIDPQASLQHNLISKKICNTF